MSRPLISKAHSLLLLMISQLGRAVRGGQQLKGRSQSVLTGLGQSCPGNCDSNLLWVLCALLPGSSKKLKLQLG